MIVLWLLVLVDIPHTIYIQSTMNNPSPIIDGDIGSNRSENAAITKNSKFYKLVSYLSIPSFGWHRIIH